MVIAEELLEEAAEETARVFRGPEGKKRFLHGK